MTGDLFPEVAPMLGVEDSDQRFTIERAKLWCLEKSGQTKFTLDVAACEESHHAPAWYGWKSWTRTPDYAVEYKLVLHDGLELPWYGVVFLQPPWSNIDAWIERAWYWMGRHDGPECIVALLPAGRAHRPWWQKWVEPFRDDGRYHSPLRKFGESAAYAMLRTHNPPERFPYGHPGNPNASGVGEPNFGSVCITWSR